jgi:hypothetical protein
MRSRIAEVLGKQNLQLLPIPHSLLSIYAQNVAGRPAVVVDVQGGFDRYIASTKGVKVLVERNVADQTYVRFESQTVGYSPMFEALVDSLLESTTASENEAAALNAMVDAFEEFRSMLSADRGQLTESAIRGLFAELLLFRELRAAGFPSTTALASWCGPYRAAKDFVLPNDRCVEIKSVRRQNHRLQISNIDQLDPRGEDLRLAVVELDRRIDGEGTSLSALVGELREWVADEAQAKAFLAQGLAAAGLDLSDPYYEQWSFDIGEWRWFQVADDFPRVRADSVPAAVVGVRYSLDLDQVASFRTDPFWSSKVED